MFFRSLIYGIQSRTLWLTKFALSDLWQFVFWVICTNFWGVVNDWAHNLTKNKIFKSGWCVNPDECWCHVGYTGPVCETPVCYPGCQNGFCNYPWECICTGGYSGMLCDICTDSTICTQPANQNAAPPQQFLQPAGGPFYHPQPPQVDKYVQNTDTGKYFHIFKYNISVVFVSPLFCILWRL